MDSFSIQQMKKINLKVNRVNEEYIPYLKADCVFYLQHIEVQLNLSYIVVILILLKTNFNERDTVSTRK